jgi:hypothetical protein
VGPVPDRLVPTEIFPANDLAGIPGFDLFEQLGFARSPEEYMGEQ